MAVDVGQINQFSSLAREGEREWERKRERGADTCCKIYKSKGRGINNAPETNALLMLDQLTPLTGSANDFVFDFDKVAELPTQVAAAHLPPTHSLARPCSSCAHLLVAHFKPVCRKL